MASEQALVDLYYATNGPQWYNNNNWLVGDPCFDRWIGVKCDSNPSIIYLYAFFLDVPNAARVANPMPWPNSH